MACSPSAKEGVGAVVQMRTDMTVPLTVNKVGIYIDREEGGQRRSVFRAEVETTLTPEGNKVQLPSTLALQNTEGTEVRVRARVIAFSADGRPLAMREARTLVPTTKLVSLPMSLLWMNTGDLVDEQATSGAAIDDVFERYRYASCSVEETLDDTGACSPIDVEDLPDYEPEPEPDADAGDCDAECFDVSTCFKPAAAELSDANFRALRARIEWFDEGARECGIPFDSDTTGMIRDSGEQRFAELAEGLAVAVRVPAEEGAFCNPSAPDECYVPLDKSAFVRRDGSPLRFRNDNLWAMLPPGVCRKWNGGQTAVAEVIAAPRCERKRPDQRICSGDRPICPRPPGRGWTGVEEPTDAPEPCEVAPHADSIFAQGGKITVFTSASTGHVLDASDFPGDCAVKWGGTLDTDALSRHRLVDLNAGPERLGLIDAHGSAFLTQRGNASLGAIETRPAAPEQFTWSVGATPRQQILFLSTDIRTAFVGGVDVPDPAEGVNLSPLEGLSNGASLPLVGRENQLFFVGRRDGRVGLIQCEFFAESTVNCLPTGDIDTDAKPQALVAGDGEFYSLQRRDDGSPELSRWFTQGGEWTGQALSLRPPGPIDENTSLSFANNTLYYTTTNGELVRIENPATATGTATLTYAGFVVSVSADPSSGLYWIEWPREDGKLLPEQAIIKRTRW